MQERDGLRPLSASQMEALEEAVSSYSLALEDPHGPGAVYLAGRGIEKATAVSFRLGVVDDPLPGHERFRGWLALPYLLDGGQPLTIRFRCLSDHEHREWGHGKYMSIADDPSRTFNVRALKYSGDDIHVTEGEFDAIILNQLGLPAIAIPGAKGFQGRHRRLIAGYSKVWVWGDPDDAGAEFTNKICRTVNAAVGVRLRDGDVTETYKRHGAQGIYDLVVAE